MDVGRTADAAQDGDAKPIGPGGIDLEGATIPQLHRTMEQGQLTSAELTEWYVHRIQQLDPQLHAVITVNPRAIDEAHERDRRRDRQEILGPLDGIPVLLKDNVGTSDMPTTAGSLALRHAQSGDAFITAQLRTAGAVILGKTNLSEWANFRSTQSSSGWSAIHGQTANPYALDRNPCGSSSGSAVAVAAHLATIAVGTETDGSIVCPAGHNGVVGIKPSVGLISRTGIAPVSHMQDTAGPMARSVTDATIMLGALTGPDPTDEATARGSSHSRSDYTNVLDHRALEGARIGVWRQGTIGISPETDTVFNAAVAVLRQTGATVVDPAVLPDAAMISGPEFTALLYEFKHDINAYLAELPGQHPNDLAALIEFNQQHEDEEMPYFGQDIFVHAQGTSGGLYDAGYLRERETATALAHHAIDDALTKHHLDAIVAPTNAPAWPTDLVNGDRFMLGSSSPAAVAGYPNVSVPTGSSSGLPIGMSIMASRWDEPKLLSYAYAFEQAAQARRRPYFLPETPAGPYGS